MRSRAGLNRDSIKMIATGTMLMNHIGLIFLERGSLIREIFAATGYFTAVTMLYFLVEGFFYTSSRKNYFLRLLAFAVISQIPFSLAFTEEGILSFQGFNMFVTLTLCFCLIRIMETEPDPVMKNISFMGIVLLSSLCDWPVMAPVYTVLFLRARKSSDPEGENRKAFGIAVAVFGLFSLLSHTSELDMATSVFYSLLDMAGMGAAAVCILYFYNGRRMEFASEAGRLFFKWFFYAFYPMHLLILGLIRIWRMGI